MIGHDGSVQIPARAIRKARRALSTHAEQVVRVLEQFETMEFVDPIQLFQLASNNTLSFIAFSCLATKRGSEQIILELSKTFFFRSSRFLKQWCTLCEALNELGVSTNLTVFLPDLEPRRTWGWQLGQDEITLACELMAEEAEGFRNQGVVVKPWSQVEEFNQVGFLQAQELIGDKAPLLVHQEAELLRSFPEIQLFGTYEEAATRQVASYAHEGRVLEEQLSSVILLQSERPPERKDRMYQRLRKVPLPIVHPFDLSRR